MWPDGTIFLTTVSNSLLSIWSVPIFMNRDIVND